MIAVHLEDRRVIIRGGRKPSRPKGFVAIRLLYGGICNTDLELQRGYLAFRGIPGHEFVGEVVEADQPEWTGKRVVGEINIACRKCEWCRRDLERHCPFRSVLGIVKYPGAFRELLVLPEHNLHIVPDTVPAEAAVFTEPLAAACEILDQVRPPDGAEVAVLGDGKLGLLIAQVLQAHHLRVRQFGRHKEKLDIARRAGIETERLRNRLPRAAFDWVVEATGSRDGLQQAVTMARPRGTVVLKSTVHGLSRWSMVPLIVDEITLVGSRCGRFEPAIALLQSGRIDPTPMISEVLPLSEAAKGFRRAAAAGVLKVLLAGTGR